jgi:hypothetical protein
MPPQVFAPERGRAVVDRAWRLLGLQRSLSTYTILASGAVDCAT